MSPNPSAAPSPETRTIFHGMDHDRCGFRVPNGTAFEPGNFGRMLPRLRPLESADAGLVELGKVMVEPADGVASPNRDNKKVPAGYTYLGQFIDHDITLDTTPLPERRIDPLGIRNFRTPALDLDCLYGNGPVAQPYLYQRANNKLFLIGTNPESRDQNGTTIRSLPNDLPRSPEKFALIGDPRNDENLIVAQLHLALLKFHNKVVQVRDVDFEEARRIVTWHYQWIVLHDFLPLLIDNEELERVLHHGRQFYRFHREPFMPVEFSVAAYRLGHSMVREAYDHNRVFGPASPAAPRLAPATLQILFTFTGLSGTGERVPVPSNWAIDWRRFFKVGALPAGANFNFSRKLDPLTAPALANLPIPDPDPTKRNLAVRNLRRGNGVGLPSGQSVACALGLESEMLTPDEIARGTPEFTAVVRRNGFDRRTPLWFYTLKEAALKGQGERLGPVGSRILAEVFVGLLQGDENSFLAQHPTWKPDLGETPGQFTMADLLKFVGEINPIGD